MLRCLHLLSRNSRIFSVNLSKRFFKLSVPASYKSVRNSNEFQFIAQFVPKYNENEKARPDQGDFELTQNYSEKTPDEMVKIFEDLSHYCAKTKTGLSDEKFDLITMNVIEKLKDMSDLQITKILVDMGRIPVNSVRERNFFQLWSALDDECFTRSRNWYSTDMLRVLNAFFHLGIVRHGNYNYKAVLKISRNIEDMKPRIFVEMMFYQSQVRAKDVPMYTGEVTFNRKFNEFNIDEIGIICLAYFKTETRLKEDSLVIKIYKKLLSELDNVRDITLVNILKALRYSSRPFHDQYMNELFEELSTRLNKFSTLACLHIALLGTNLQNCHQVLIERIVERFNREVENIRLKDMDRIALVIGLYDLKTQTGVEEELLRNLIVQLKKRVSEIIYHPKCFTSTLHYMTMKGIYDLELIESALKESFLVYAYGKNLTKYSREILCLDSFTRINLKGIYTGPQLQGKTRKEVAKYTSHYIPYKNQPYKLTHADKLLLDCKEIAEMKFGKNVLALPLPHYERADIIYCFDETGKSVTAEIEDCFPSLEGSTGEILSKSFLLSQKQPFADNIEKYKMVAIIIGGWNFFIRDTYKPTGSLRMKVEQLEMIGYTPVLIHWYDWSHKSLDVKEQLLVDKINEAIGRGK